MFETEVLNSKGEKIAIINKIMLYELVDNLNQSKKYEKAIIEENPMENYIKIKAETLKEILSDVVDFCMKLEKSPITMDIPSDEEELEYERKQFKVYREILRYLVEHSDEQYLILKDLI